MTETGFRFLALAALTVLFAGCVSQKHDTISPAGMVKPHQRLHDIVVLRAGAHNKMTCVEKTESDKYLVVDAVVNDGNAHDIDEGIRLAGSVGCRIARKGSVYIVTTPSALSLRGNPMNSKCLTPTRISNDSELVSWFGNICALNKISCGAFGVSTLASEEWSRPVNAAIGTSVREVMLEAAFVRGRYWTIIVKPDSVHARVLNVTFW